MTDHQWAGAGARVEGEIEMAERKATHQLVDLVDRADRLAQDLADLRRRIDARPKRWPSSGNMPSVPPPALSEPDDQADRITLPSLPVRRDTPSSSDTVFWLPVVKQRSPSRSGLPAMPSRSPSDPAYMSATSSRSPGSGARRKDPEAGRYSIIAAGRGKRRASP
jgi:hypothetical protein